MEGLDSKNLFLILKSSILHHRIRKWHFNTYVNRRIETHESGIHEEGQGSGAEIENRIKRSRLYTET